MKLFFREVGQGTPVVILHGLFGMSDNWMTFAKRLSSDYHLFLLDLRNHGRSPHAAEMSYGAMAADVYNFVRETIKVPCNIFGHSMGGKVAMTLALREPEWVRSLVSVDIAPKRYFSPKFQEFLQVMMHIDLNKLTSRKEADGLLEDALHLHPATRQFLLKNLYRTADNRFGWRLNLPVLYDNLYDLLGGIDQDGQYEKAALFARGSESDYIADADREIIHKWFPRAGIVDIESANHWVHSSAPEALEMALRDFWRSALPDV